MTDPMCHRVRADFELYLDGALTRDEASALEDHLLACIPCAAAVGEDVRLGERMEAVAGAPPKRSLKPSIQRVAASIAGIALLAGTFALGRSSFRPGRDAPVTAPARTASTELMPVAEDFSEWVGFASYSDMDLLEAERDALRSRVDRTEYRVSRAECELDLVRPLIEENVTADRIVERLRANVRSVPQDLASRPSHGNGSLGDHFRQVRVASALLRRDAHAAFPVVSRWLATADTTLERRTAVKLLASLRVPEAVEPLVAEASVAGPTRELALNGLLELRDPTSRDVFSAVLDDPDAALDPTRITAAGGLHRLGDSRGLAFLVGAFKEHADPAGLSMRKRILFHVGANPTPAALAAMADMLDEIRLDRRARSDLALWLSLCGVPEGDPAMRALVRAPG